MTNGARGGSDRRGLERILSKAGVCSRTQARAWIRAGRVRVNGALILDPDAWFDVACDRVTIDEKPLSIERKLYVMLHKPRGYLTTRTDPGGRATVYDLLADVDAWLIAVGRLDLDTSGLLLFSNDTQFSERITNPLSHVPKVYRVTARPPLDREALERLRTGVLLHDGPTRPAHVERVEVDGSSSSFELSISEGRNRQVRRMVRAVGSRVESLARIAIGPLVLGNLAPGAHRRLNDGEVRALLARARSAEG